MAIGWKISKPVPAEFKTSAGLQELPASLPASNQPRAVYRYSVIPGGVLTAEELAVQLNSDPVAARHYADFRVTHAVLVSNTFVRERAYVSYRVGTQILWTKKQVHIDKTEALLTDGRTFARSRCGNRLSETPQEPTAETDPIEEALLYLPPPTVKLVLRFPEELELAPTLPSLPGYKLPEVNTIAITDQIGRRVSVLSTPAIVRTAKSLTSVGDIPEPASKTLTVSGTALLAYVVYRRRHRRLSCSAGNRSTH